MKRGVVLTSGDGGGNRTLSIALLALLVAAGGYIGYDRFFADRPAPVPEGAILPATRPAPPPEATPPAGANVAAGTTAGAPAAPGARSAARGAAATKGAAGAKPADAARTVAVPTAPAAKAPAAKAPAAKAAQTPAAGVKPAAPATPPATVGKAVTTPALPSPRAAAGTSTQSVATPRQGPSPELSTATIQREVYSYEGARRRDPFVSLAKQSESGPLLAELKLVGIAYDEVGRNSVAVFRDQTKGLYRVKIGQSVGRARVVTIGRRSVTFNVDEFGVTRQEVMTLRDTTRKGM
ncbi:MAG: hypothetical protein ACK6AH_14255 [Gemmatimonadota bacterium]